MLIKTNPDIIRSYFEDSSNLKGGHAEKIVIPSTVAELTELVKETNSKKMPITVSGGGTGTTGARIPFGGIVISMEKLNKIIGISKADGTAVVQTGVLVDELKNESEKNGLFYTSHPTEKTASVGGTVATNASGSRSFKYGSTRKYVKRLKMVLANGELFEIKRGAKILMRYNSRIKLTDSFEIEIPIPTYKMPDVKSSAGYFAKDGMDLIDLFIGQEGTLSIITEIEFGLVKKSDDIFSCFVFFKKDEDAFAFADDVKRLSKSKTLDVLSLEYFDSNALKLLRPNVPNIPHDAASAIFFEQETEDKNDASLMQKWFDIITKHNGSSENTWAAMSKKEMDRFTGLRHAVPDTINDIVRRRGFQKISTDIAVPDRSFKAMTDFYKSALRKEDLEHVIFGHIGENHLHVNILPNSADELSLAKDICFDFVRKAISLDGTVSAEHGIGKLRHKYLEEMYGKNGILEMARIKKTLDPNCILGLDNIFPREILTLV